MIFKHMYPIVLLAFAALACSESSSDNNNTNTGYEPSELKTTLVESNNSFAFDIFNEIIANEEAGTNVFISPLSMYYALAMAANGANNNTYDEFAGLLGWEGFERTEILQSMKELDAQIIPADGEVTVEVANSMWPKVGYPIKETYINEIVGYFNSEVNDLDVTNPDILEIINGWIEDKTHGKIVDMLDYIPDDVVLYLINAIYFKGTWLYEFADTSNYESSFSCSNGTSPDVTYMTQTTSLDYFRNENVTVVKLPYVDSNYCMTIFLPQNPVDGFIADLNKENWSNWQAELERKNISLSLPKFKIEFGTRKINDELKTLGLQTAFSSAADFSNITDGDIFISRVLHKAFVEVNEEGTEAAAATIVEFRENAVIDPNAPVEVKINRPFAFTITEEQTQNIMFIGKVEIPKYDN